MNALEYKDFLLSISKEGSDIDQIAEKIYENKSEIIKYCDLIGNYFPINFVLDKSSELNSRTLQQLLLIATLLSESQEFPFFKIEHEMYFNKLIEIMRVKGYFRAVVKLVINFCSNSKLACSYYLQNDLISTLNSFPKCGDILRLATVLIKSVESSDELNSDELIRLFDRHSNCKSELTLMRNIEFAGILTSLNIGDFHNKINLKVLLSSENEATALSAVKFLLQINEPDISYVDLILEALARHPIYMAADVFKLLEKNADLWSGFQNDIIVGYLECVMEKLPSDLLRICISTLLHYINFENEWDDTLVRALFTFIEEDYFALELLKILAMGIDRKTKGEDINYLDEILRDSEEEIENLVHNHNEDISALAEIILSYISTEL